MAEERGLTNRILSAAQRLEGGTASSLPYSPPRQTLSDPARPAVQPGKDFQQDMISDVVNDGLFGPTAQANYAMLLDYALRPPGELFSGRTSAATASEVIADRFPGRPEGSLANVGTELAVGLAEPGPGEFRGLLELAAVLPPSVMTALGKASGLVDRAGDTIRLGHGTPTSFDVPRESESGFFGPGFYAAQIKVDDRYIDQSRLSNFNEYTGRDPGAQVRPGFAGGPVLNSSDKTPFSEDEAQNILSLFSQRASSSLTPDGDNSKVYEKLKTAYQNGTLTPRTFWDTIAWSVPANEVPTVMRSLGYSGVKVDPNHIVIYDPAQNFVPMFDADAIRTSIQRAGEEGRVSSEELNWALEDLSEFLGE